MLNKKITFTSSELNSSGTINLKEVFIAETKEYYTFNYRGEQIKNIETKYKYPKGILIKNTTGAPIKINLLTSGEAVNFDLNSSNAPLIINNNETWYPNYLYPLPATFKAWARIDSGTASSNLDIIFINYA